MGKREATVEEGEQKAPSASTLPASFSALQLDERLQRAVAKLKYAQPTKIQAEAIPPLLEGRDVLAQSRTGSGKTDAYLLPLLDILLRAKALPRVEEVSTLSAIILVPSRELAAQVIAQCRKLLVLCGTAVRLVNLAEDQTNRLQSAILSETPDLIISTPSRFIDMVHATKMDLHHLKMLVLDEADLLMSYGYKDDLTIISKMLTTGVQCVLMTASLSGDMDALKHLYAKDPIAIYGAGSDDHMAKRLSQFITRCSSQDRYLLLYVVFKLKLISGKSIVFVGDIDQAYRVRLFLEQFGIRSCVMNPELPVNSRLHIIEEFNKSVYEILVAPDTADADIKLDAVDQTEGGEAAKQKPKEKSSRESGVSRGIDFRDVKCILNFDLPKNGKVYTHRIGRTARAGSSGTVLSFVVPEKLNNFSKTASAHLGDEKKAEAIITSQAEEGLEVKPFKFDMKQVNAFRYRMDDAFRAVTRSAVTEARLKELRHEVMESDKLRRHFEEHPADLQHLRHDLTLGTRRQPHLKHVPKYLLAATEPGLLKQSISDVGFGKSTENRIRKAHKLRKSQGKKPKSSDPLRSFKSRSKASRK